MCFFLTVLKADSLPASGTFGISSVNNFLTTGCIKVVDVSGSSFKLFGKGISFRFSKEVFTMCCWTFILKLLSAIVLKRTLESTIFIIAPSTMRFVETVWSAFSKSRLFLANIFKGFLWLFPRFFDPYHMRSKLFSKEVSFILPQYIFIFHKHSFSFSTIFHYHFQDLSRRVNYTESEAWPSNKVTCSTKVTNLSPRTSTAWWDGALWMFSNPFHKRDKRPITSRIFPWTFSIWWSDVMTVCGGNNNLTKSSRGFTSSRFERTRFSVNNCSSVSLSEM